jgi:hypothetical protein
MYGKSSGGMTLSYVISLGLYLTFSDDAFSDIHEQEVRPLKGIGH